MTEPEAHWSAAYPDPPLTDGVIRLRRWDLDDLACIEAASTDRRITESTSVPAGYSTEAAIAFVKRQWARQTHEEALSLAIGSVTTGHACGFVGLMRRPQPGTVGLGYWIATDARANGYATRAACLVTRWALATGQVHRIEAHVEPDNEPSKRVLLAAGFSLEGHLRSALVLATRRADALTYSLLPGDVPRGI